MKIKTIQIISIILIIVAVLAGCADDILMYQQEDKEVQKEDNAYNGSVISGDYKELGESISSQFDELDVAGVAIAIVDGNDMPFFISDGYMNVEKRIPINKDTAFLIASITKTITGTAIMQLAEDGKIDLDADINEYLPYEIYNPEYPNKKISVRMLLCHTSSIIDNWDALDETYTYGSNPEISLKEFCEAYFTENGNWYDEYENYSDNKPGTYYEYSNSGYALLGYIVENITGKQFYEYCDDNIFDPLGMNNTSLMLEDMDINNIAVPYSYGEAVEHYTFSTYPDGGLRTSCDDFAKFISMMIGNGTYKNTEILKAETVKKMLEAQYSGIAYSQGLTWDLAINEIYDIDSEYTIVGHNGGETGVETLMLFNPETEKGAMIFVNDELSKKQTKIFDNIVELLIEYVNS